MAKICLCLTGKTLARDLEIIDKYRKYVDIAELRADCLDPDERFLIRRFPEMAGIPVILSIRRNRDGGRFMGGEGSRITLLANGLAFADADRRRNFAFVDLEEDLNVPSLEEAARAFGTRVIRSWHNMEGVDDDLAGRLKKLRRVGDELVKASVMARSLDDVVKVYKAAKETAGIEKILLCMGEYGVNTRILAELVGSRFSYASPSGESDLLRGAPGQLDPKELAESFRFRDITQNTRIFAVTGYPLKVSATPKFFNTVFSIERIDAVCVPIPANSVSSLMKLAEEINISGISVTFPYKEQILPFLARKSQELAGIGACDTIVPGPSGWTGYNTNAVSFSAALLEFLGRKNLRGMKFTLVGAGGTARAVAAELYRLRGKALILNRTPSRARSLAQLYGFAWAGLDSSEADFMKRYSRFIIQASPVGMDPNPENDPIDFYKFSGKETVIDLVYKPEKTSLLRRAEEAGCKTLSGYDMLHRQARYQYHYFMNEEFPSSLISRVRFD
jgi:3-dehydroquinate dehydratase/shikimate dehydrogenase